VSLVDVWNGTGGTFDGGKITPATLALSKLLSAQQSSIDLLCNSGMVKV